LKNIKVNQKQFAEILGINPSSVDAARQKGYIIRDSDGLYDLNNSENKAYVKGRGIDIKEIVIPPILPAGRPLPGRKPTGEIKSPSSGIEKSAAELNRELTAKKIERLQLEIDRRRKVLLHTTFVEYFLIRHIETLHSNIERNAATSIKDFGKEILNAGEVTPELINRWINLFLNLCHTTKQKIQNEIQNYQPEEGSK